jgi:hypothetical protein
MRFIIAPESLTFDWQMEDANNNLNFSGAGESSSAKTGRGRDLTTPPPSRSVYSKLEEAAIEFAIRAAEKNLKRERDEKRRLREEKRIHRELFPNPRPWREELAALMENLCKQVDAQIRPGWTVDDACFAIAFRFLPKRGTDREGRTIIITELFEDGRPIRISEYQLKRIYIKWVESGRDSIVFQPTKTPERPAPSADEMKQFIVFCEHGANCLIDGYYSFKEKWEATHPGEKFPFHPNQFLTALSSTEKARLNSICETRKLTQRSANPATISTSNAAAWSSSAPLKSLTPDPQPESVPSLHNSDEEKAPK